MNNTGFSIKGTRKPKESSKVQGIECTFLVFLSTSNSLILFIFLFFFLSTSPQHNVPYCSQTPLKLNQDPPMVAKCITCALSHCFWVASVAIECVSRVFGAGSFIFHLWFTSHMETLSWTSPLCVHVIFLIYFRVPERAKRRKPMAQQ